MFDIITVHDPTLSLDSGMSTSTVDQDNSRTSADVKTGDWVAVMYSKKWYPGLVESRSSEQIVVNFMVRKAKKFRWPEHSDRQTLFASGILCIFKNAPYSIPKDYFGVIDSDSIDTL